MVCAATIRGQIYITMGDNGEIRQDPESRRPPGFWGTGGQQGNDSWRPRQVHMRRGDNEVLPNGFRAPGCQRVACEPEVRRLLKEAFGCHPDFNPSGAVDRALNVLALHRALTVEHPRDAAEEEDVDLDEDLCMTHIQADRLSDLLGLSD